MPAIRCPIQGCTYITPDQDAVIVAALITAHSAAHTQGQSVAAKAERVKRPTISAAGSSEDWEYFKSRWQEYVIATKVTGNEKAIQLLECCDETLRKDLTRDAGGTLTNKTEDEILAAIKKLAVREENAVVARVTLHNMKQDRDETVRSYGARLRGQAGICKFAIACPSCHHNVNYTEPILRDILTRSIADPEIQLDLLGNSNQEMSLEDVFKFVEIKEAGKRSASRLLDSHTVEAAKSTYSRNKQPSFQDNTAPCLYCGRKGHGKKAPTSLRKSKCPAFNH